MIKTIQDRLRECKDNLWIYIELAGYVGDLRQKIEQDMGMSIDSLPDTARENYKALKAENRDRIRREELEEVKNLLEKCDEIKQCRVHKAYTDLDFAKV